MILKCWNTVHFHINSRFSSLLISFLTNKMYLNDFNCYDLLRNLINIEETIFDN